MKHTLWFSCVLVAAVSIASHAHLIDATSDMLRGHMLTAINAGGPSLTSPSGDVYASGIEFASGTRKAYVNPNGASAAIVNATTWELPLFNSMEYTFKPDFDLRYTLPLAGPTTNTVEVELLFSELDRGISLDQRLFDVFINGELALSNFDIYAAAGGRERAVRVSMFLSPAPSEVEVTFGKVARKNKPAICGVVCYNVSNQGSTASAVTTTTTVTTTSTSTTIVDPVFETTVRTSDASVLATSSSLSTALTSHTSSK